MTTDHQRRFARVLALISELYPDWRIGQIVANIALFARGPAAEAVWDVEDEEFLVAAEAHVARRQLESPSQSQGSTSVSRVG
jgi:hypothetical protein